MYEKRSGRNGSVAQLFLLHEKREYSIVEAAAESDTPDFVTPQITLGDRDRKYIQLRRSSWMLIIPIIFAKPSSVLLKRMGKKLASIISYTLWTGV